MGVVPGEEPSPTEPTCGCHPAYHELGVHAPGVDPRADPPDFPDPDEHPPIG